jgi:hypothetical protein
LRRIGDAASVNAPVTVRFGTNYSLDKNGPRVCNCPALLVWEIAMQDYDIHIFNPAGHLSLSVSGRYASDLAARRAAEHLTKENERVEVWSSKGRIFVATPRAATGGTQSAA